MPRISIIIRSYNEEQHIGRLLHGIEMQSLSAVEVILVDSGSTDSTVPIAEKYGVKIVYIPKEDFTFGRALNRGCEVASGDFLLFASAHVYPLRRDWLEKIVAPFADPEVVLCYGRQVGNGVTRFSEHQVFKSWFPAESVARQAHNFCNNANCVILRSWWQRYRYDETLTGLEDLAWAKKTMAAGGQIAYAAAAVIAHVHDETWSSIRNRYRREALALRQIEPGIQFSWLDFLYLTATNTLSDLCSAGKQGVLLGSALDIALFRFNQFFGTWQGHHQTGDTDAALRNLLYFPGSTNTGETLAASATFSEIDYSVSHGMTTAKKAK